MDYRESGNDGEGCRNDGEGAGMTAWRSGPLIQNGVNGNLPLTPMAKAGQPGWQATEGFSPQPCHSAALGHGPPPPHPYPKLGLDHVLPKAKGGTDQPSNLQLLCSGCNRSKGSCTMAEWRAAQRANVVHPCI